MPRARPIDDPPRDALDGRMKAAMKVLDGYYNADPRQHIGLILLVSDLGSDGHTDYITNVPVSECVSMLEEVLTRWRAKH